MNFYSKCKQSSQCWMRLFGRFSNTVHCEQSELKIEENCRKKGKKVGLFDWFSNTVQFSDDWGIRAFEAKEENCFKPSKASDCVSSCIGYSYSIWGNQSRKGGQKEALKVNLFLLSTAMPARRCSCASRSTLSPIWWGWGSAAANSWCAEGRPPALEGWNVQRTRPDLGGRHPTLSRHCKIQQNFS